MQSVTTPPSPERSWRSRPRPQPSRCRRAAAKHNSAVIGMGHCALRQIFRPTMDYPSTSMRRAVGVAIIGLTACLSGCAARVPAATPPGGVASILETREGLASYYGREFHGRTTASGIPFDMNAMVAAHPSYPFGTLLRVTNLVNGRSTNVRVVDRGPAPQLQANGIIIDLSRKAAEVLGFIQQGRARVRLDVPAWSSP
jgi:rare lipoprotein A